MSTRCNIQIFDSGDKKPGAILYHHSDGYPEFMEKKLRNFMVKAFQVLKMPGIRIGGMLKVYRQF